VTEEQSLVTELRLERSGGLRDLTDELAATLQRVGVSGVLANLNRTAQPVTVPALAAAEGFAWEPGDRRNLEWYPQGITWADSADTGGLDGRRIIVTSWYGKERRGRPRKGARVTFVDYTDADRPRYRHVLLVEPFREPHTGAVSFRPVPVHAGGIVWFGDYLFVCGTAAGIRAFELADLTAVPGRPGDRDLIGRRPDGHFSAFDYAFVLPQSFAYVAWGDHGVEWLRYSFLSIDRTSEVPQLIAGEYGHGRATTRLARYALDPETRLLSTRADGHAWPLELVLRGVERMQGAVRLHGRWAITSSRGPTSRGDLWVGAIERLQRRRGVLAIGPEDITYWRTHRQLWTLSEWPMRRWVYGIDADRWLDQ
jgi:hypothetical protein